MKEESKLKLLNVMVFLIYTNLHYDIVYTFSQKSIGNLKFAKPTVLIFKRRLFK